MALDTDRCYKARHIAAQSIKLNFKLKQNTVE